MPMRGSRRLRPAFLLSLVMIMVTMMLGTAFPQQGSDAGTALPLVPYRVDGDQIAAPLTGVPGDPGRGAALFGNRQISACLLCHADPATPQPSTETIGPSLAGIGSRLTAGQIRLRIVDAARLNPETVMPSFYMTAGLRRVGRQWQGRPILDAAQIEDLVAFLAIQQVQ
jgi:L-cysteine S-thiosulfotransferase